MVRKHTSRHETETGLVDMAADVGIALLVAGVGSVVLYFLIPALLHSEQHTLMAMPAMFLLIFGLLLIPLLLLKGLTAFSRAIKDDDSAFELSHFADPQPTLKPAAKPAAQRKKKTTVTSRRSTRGS